MEFLKDIQSIIDKYIHMDLVKRLIAEYNTTYLKDWNNEKMYFCSNDNNNLPYYMANYRSNNNSDVYRIFAPSGDEDKLV